VVQALSSLQLPPLVGAQAPSEPGTLQAWHCPQLVPVVLQHTPSTHTPAPHWAFDVHDPPNSGGVTVTVKVSCDRFCA
jgi:hypothetical protein